MLPVCRSSPSLRRLFSSRRLRSDAPRILLSFARSGRRRPLASTGSSTMPRGGRRRSPPASASASRARASPPARRPRCGSSTTSDTLYVGILARDREPEAVIGRILERDRVMTQGLDNAAKFTGDDVVAFTLDPFHDHRNAFFFATNPNGAEFDALVTDESPTLNVDWRAVWRVAARRVPEGWSAEFAIPFRSLRYPRARGRAGVGLRRRADRPPAERGHAVERLDAGGGRAQPGEPRRSPRGPRRPAALGGERRAAAVRPRRPDRGGRATAGRPRDDARGARRARTSSGR